MGHEQVKTIITFQTPPGTEWRASKDPRHFVPNFFSVSKENIEAKIKGIKCHEFEKRPYPYPCSPIALIIQAQRWRVAICYEYPEPFCLVRIIS